VSSLWAYARTANRSSESSTAVAGSGPAALPLLWRGKKLADHLNVPPATLNTWRRRGWVLAQRCADRWVYWADEAELARLTQLRRHPRVTLTRVPSHLTTPIGSPPWQQESDSTSSRETTSQAANHPTVGQLDIPLNTKPERKVL